MNLEVAFQLFLLVTMVDSFVLPVMWEAAGGQGVMVLETGICAFTRLQTACFTDKKANQMPPKVTLEVGMGRCVKSCQKE